MPGPGTDEPLVWYEGAGTSDRRWLHADTQGSVIGYSDGSGNSGATYPYDLSGLPDSGSTSASHYRYTGQTMIPEAHLYYYKARMYDPMSGRFLQTDPVGRQSDINLYAYVGNDPINGWDPSGMATPDTTDPGYRCVGASDCDPSAPGVVLECDDPSCNTPDTNFPDPIVVTPPGHTSGFSPFFFGIGGQ